MILNHSCFRLEFKAIFNVRSAHWVADGPSFLLTLENNDAGRPSTPFPTRHCLNQPTTLLEQILLKLHQSKERVCHTLAALFPGRGPVSGTWLVLGEDQGSKCTSIVPCRQELPSNSNVAALSAETAEGLGPGAQGPGRPPTTYLITRYTKMRTQLPPSRADAGTLLHTRS